MSKIFNSITDINGKQKKYPIDSSVFFSCEDNTFYIYALYTKVDLSASEIIQVSEDVFISELAKLDDSTIKMDVKNYSMVKAFTLLSSIKSMTDSLTIGELLELNNE